MQHMPELSPCQAAREATSPLGPSGPLGMDIERVRGARPASGEGSARGASPKSLLERSALSIALRHIRI